MNRIKNVIAFAVCAVATVALARFDATSDFKKFMDKEGPKFVKAFENKDISYFEKASTSDFSYKEFGKPATNRKESLKGLKEMFAMMKSIDVDYKLHSVKVNGNTAIVMLTSTFKGTTQPMPPDNKPHKMEATTYEKETWVRSGKTWKLKKIEETKKSKMMMDGKPFDPAAMGGG